MNTSSSAHATAAASTSSSRCSNRWKYEVFLSFRGDDTRTTFTDHLSIALPKAGINSFIDYQLRRGENIQSELDLQIEGSRISIVVFSKRYAESRWCLRKLAKIVRCPEDEERKVVYPIFYDVDPSEVRKQSGSSKAFRKHERDEDPNEIEQWRRDLKASADLGGRNLKTTVDGLEGLFIDKIVADIIGLLKATDLKEAKHSVGIAFRVQEFRTKYLDVGGSHDVQIIGNWGMGGIGKITLARAIYNKFQHGFTGQCYLEEVRSKRKNMVRLQEQLLQDILKRSYINISSVAEGTKEIEKRLGSMKVLIVVDDVDDANQLNDLAIKHDLFGARSRIIITTRDEQVLNIHKVDKIYEAQTMTDFGTEAIEGLTNFLKYSDEHSFSAEAFKKMRLPKFLQLNYIKVTGSYSHLSKNLRSLCWRGFPLEVIPEDFDIRNLVFIDLSYSKLVRVWKDSDLMLEKLKFLILRHSHNLTQLPDFSKLPHLHQLNLSGCKGVSGGYHSLGQLKMIDRLDLSDCNITDDPGLESLGSLSSPTILVLNGNGFNRLPIPSGLSQLEILFLNHCANLQAIPDLRTSLPILEAEYCTELEIMPDFSEMSHLRELKLRYCHKLKDILNLENSLYYLHIIHLEGCSSLTVTFKKNILKKWNVGNVYGGIVLSGHDIVDIPYLLANVVRVDETVKFEVPPSVDDIEGLAVCIIYFSDHSECSGSLCIDVVNRPQRTYFPSSEWMPP